jgi:hypothetical protein
MKDAKQDSVKACQSMQPVSSSSRPCAQKKVQDARSKLFIGLYDGSTGNGSPSASVVRCPSCRRTVGNVTGSGWRQAVCDTCGSSLALRQLDRNGKRFAQVQLLNPDSTDDDATSRRFALLEIE